MIKYIHKYTHQIKRHEQFSSVLISVLQSFQFSTSWTSFTFSSILIWCCLSWGSILFPYASCRASYIWLPTSQWDVFRMDFLATQGGGKTSEREKFFLGDTNSFNRSYWFKLELFWKPIICCCSSPSPFISPFCLFSRFKLVQLELDSTIFFY